ncbi:MAG: iron ABC transporter permease, partial [Oscillospiraceae bacterium]|nr:iron ABC transporter permease [Oscillospiraceae bacterium]
MDETPRLSSASTLSQKTHRAKLTVFILLILLVVAILISFMLGKYPIQPGEVLRILFSKVFSIEKTWTDQMELIFFNVRLPRILLACLVGCSLATAGAAYQGTFKNPMASPDILGASQGAAFGAALAIMNHLGNRYVTVFAFGFSILTVFLVILVSTKAKGGKIVGLILAGIMISSLFQAATSYLKLVADPDDQLPAITYWLMGSFAGVKFSDVLFALIPMAVGLVPLFLLRWRMNLLTMGDEEARTMGVNVPLVRLIVILASTLVTAASVSVSGMIGWVGLVIPHLSRRLVGDNYASLIPTSMVFGALFLLIVDNFSRN